MNLLYILIFILIFTHVYITVHACVWAPVGAQKRVLCSLELEVVVSHLAWVLRNELGSSKTKASVLND